MVGILPLCRISKNVFLKALKNIHPEDSSMYCARHKYNNFRKVYPDPKLKGLYWDAVRATNEFDFKHAIDSIKSVNKDAWKWLLQDEPKHWPLHAFDHHVKVDHVTNNMTESFNAWIEKSRQFPILTLLEYIRRKVMKKIYKRFEKGNAWESEIPPMVRKKLNQARKNSRHIQGLSNGDKYEVYDNERTCLVNLDKKTCQCGMWQISGLPCKESIACIHNKQVDPLDYVDPYFTKSAYLRTYSGRINTVEDSSAWTIVQHPTILPPKKRSNKSGRPAMNRKREADEPLRKKKKKFVVIHCKFCHEHGHNKAGCPQRLENQGKMIGELINY
ncbi:uncharacterized protein [Henckelia pumila]|uniref:uncharacterized protein n=1 Tax=Henckelia pumila TaxID=405737 RepID=UPI003C6E9FD9